jgi:hypothetical protein
MMEEEQVEELGKVTKKINSRTEEEEDCEVMDEGRE